MLIEGRSNLTQFLIEERRRHPRATGELNALVTDVSLACKAIAARVARGALGQEAACEPTLQFAREAFTRGCEWGGNLAGYSACGEAEATPIPEPYTRGKYLLLFQALDGAGNLDINHGVGSLFSVLRAPTAGAAPTAEDWLQAGAKQVCAGYALYGAATMLVLSLGNGTHGFTLDPQLGEWMLSHPNLQVPRRTREFAINASHSRFWEPAVKRYVDECLAGSAGVRGADFSMRWIASLVAETHRILLRGGVFLCPRDGTDPKRPGRLQLLHEANPVGMLIEQAGGCASTGRHRVLGLQPEALQQRVGFIFGSAEEVERIERYHEEQLLDGGYRSPLFGQRGLFAPV
ncbi:class 1 fructose-bisphosphatase [Azohydromonas caseinilytica]|uniref:Fructose-1,6-bisphosphatase class 1 n=1 Tax=Azohydromonas caseinilytica TaxID=2728836 RepID=A0A848F8X6_9BURK|nr:class 1 fructose-bisphosphatase [Azohydromonas caseinilytica]NML15802.1 class 1 fructose-bisphosphatase [Azohydromonas caseinilytica]